MNFIDRLNLSWKALTSARFAHQLISSWENNQPSYTTVNFGNNVRQGYKKNELIFACIDKKADSTAMPHLRVYGKNDGLEIPTHPLAQLITKPNPFMTEFDFFSSIMILLDLAGVSYWEKIRSGSGRVVELWPLRPDWLAPVRNGESFISGYQYKIPEISDPFPMKTQDVLSFKIYDPVNMYNGMAPVNVAARIGDVDNSATDFVKMFFEKGGVPPFLLSSRQKLIDSQVTDIRRRWVERYGGQEKWNSGPAVLDSDATFQKTGLTFEEMGFGVLDDRDEARLCMVLKVPPILVNARVGLNRATYANYSEARRAFWEDTLMPQFRRISDNCSVDLGGEFGNDFHLRWDFSEVPALQEEQKDRWDRATKALSAGAITVNQFQIEIGKPSFGPEGDVFIRSVAMVAVPAKVAASKSAGKKEFKTAPDDEERLKKEKAIKKTVEDFLSAQQARVIKKVKKNA
jgi:HK97 family phage portal protein